MKKKLVFTFVCLSLAINLFSQDTMQAPPYKPTIYDIRQQYLNEIRTRYADPVNGQRLYLKKIGIQTPEGIEYIEEQRYESELDPQHEQIQEWFDYLEPRLYPSGQFIDASKIMLKEIKRIEKNSRSNEKQQGTCNATAQWQSIGPFVYNTNNSNNQTEATISQTQHQSSVPGIGRVNFIRKHPNNNTLYIGSSNGGLWTSTDNGVTWAVLNDQIAVLGTSDLVFDPNNANTMYLVTGDKSRGGVEAIGTTTYTLGILQSTNGGQTWAELATNVKWKKFNDSFSQGNYMKINRLIVTPTNELIIGTTDCPLTKGSGNIESGIWKWNGIDTWDMKLMTPNPDPNIDQGSAISDIIQLSNGKIIAATQHGKLYSSADNGNTFTPITSPEIPTTNVGRVAFAVCPSNPNAFYVLFVGNDGRFRKLVKSPNNGSTLNNINFPTTTEFFTAGKEHLAITVSPVDENVVFLAGNREIYKLIITLNGTLLAANASPQSSYVRPSSLSDDNYVHPDVKGFTWTDNSTLYVATDGGIACTTDGGTTWTKWYELTRNLAISECYCIGVVPNNPDVAFVGTHDNGVWRWDKNSNNNQWINIKEGDCGEVAPISTNEFYANYFIDNIILKYLNTGLSTDFIWNKYNRTPVWTSSLQLANPGTKAVLFSDGSSIYTSHTQFFKGLIAANYFPWNNCIASYYTTSSPAPTPGIIPINHEEAVISALGVAPSNNNILYIGKRSVLHYEPNYPKAPLIYRSDDAGTTWLPVYAGLNTIYGTSTSLQNNQNLPELHLNRIAVHPTDPLRLWVVFSGYKKDMKVYESTDGGATWSNITGGGLPNLPVNAITAYEKDGLVHLVIGTDVGVYYSNETLIGCVGGAQWKYFGQGATTGHDFPNVIVQELEVHGIGANRVLRAATFGRGVWETPLPNISSCTCSVCGEEGYPLMADFIALPEDAILDPQFEPVTNWGQWLTTFLPIKFQDASTGIIQDNSYNWVFENVFLPLNCEGDLLSNEPCASVSWEAAGSYNVTLTVTDVTGCTSSATKTVAINEYEDCIIESTPIIHPKHPIQTCDIITSTCPIPNENDSLFIEPISTEFGSGAYRYEITAVGNPTFFASDVDLELQDNGQLKLSCLATDTYNISVLDQITGCEVITNVTLNEPTPQSLLFTDIATTANSGDPCNGMASIIAINNEPITESFSYSWSDCSTCNTPERTDLCAGTYSVTVTSTSGCQGTKAFIIKALCAGGYPDGGTGIVIDAMDIYPTIFDDIANVKLRLNHDAEVTIDVYNLYGTPIKRLMDNEIKEAGEYYLQDNESNVSDGFYIYIVKACSETKGDIGIKH